MCSPRKSDEKFSILTFLWIKTNVAYTRLEVIAKQRSSLQVEFIAGVKLICYFVLYYCFLHWDHLPNMAVGDLAFYYTLYLWKYYTARALMKSCLLKVYSLILNRECSQNFKHLKFLQLFLAFLWETHFPKELSRNHFRVKVEQFSFEVSLMRLNFYTSSLWSNAYARNPV